MMILNLTLALHVAAMTPQSLRPVFDCPEADRAIGRARLLSELPSEIRDDLKIFTNNEITDEDIPLLNTDAPSPAEMNYATARFVQALQFRDRWLVQFEVALFAGVRTVAYVSRQGRPFERSPTHYFGGPACASIRAALEGVTTPGGF